MAQQWQFIFAVFCMYGFLFMMYTIEGSPIPSAYGLDSASIFETVATEGVETGGFTDWLTGGIGTLIGFFTILFVPLNAKFWWMTMINWAVVGTTTYLFLKMIRGGG